MEEHVPSVRTQGVCVCVCMNNVIMVQSNRNGLRLRPRTALGDLTAA